MTATPLDTHLAPIGRRPRLGGAVAIALVVAVLAGGAALWSWRTNEPVLSATLNAPVNAGGWALFKARLEPRRHRVTITPLTPSPKERRPHARQLWLTPAGGLPHSAGLIDSSRTSLLILDETLLKALGSRGTLGVSLEPVGGSPTGLPTSPMIAEGPLSPGGD